MQIYEQNLILPSNRHTHCQFAILHRDSQKLSISMANFTGGKKEKTGHNKV